MLRTDRWTDGSRNEHRHQSVQCNDLYIPLSGSTLTLLETTPDLSTNRVELSSQISDPKVELRGVDDWGWVCSGWIGLMALEKSTLDLIMFEFGLTADDDAWRSLKLPRDRLSKSSNSTRELAFEKFKRRRVAFETWGDELNKSGLQSTRRLEARLLQELKIGEKGTAGNGDDGDFFRRHGSETGSKNGVVPWGVLGMFNWRFKLMSL